MDQPATKNYGPLGCQVGCLLAILLYFYPLPVALIVWSFDLQGLFADYMYLALPVLALLPVIGFAIGLICSKRPYDVPPPPRVEPLDSK